MDWTDEVREKIRRKNQLLFDKRSSLLQGLAVQIGQQSHRTLVLWALDLSEETVSVLKERYPGETRPQEALAASRLWAAGESKMPAAQRAILRCHGLAKELASPEDAALCHAVGQGCSVVHTAGHAMGYPIYELTAMVRRLGVEEGREAVERRVEAYGQKLLYWAAYCREHDLPWADFLKK